MRGAIAGLAVTFLGFGPMVAGPVSVRATGTCPTDHVCTYTGLKESGQATVFNPDLFGRCIHHTFQSVVNATTAYHAFLYDGPQCQASAKSAAVSPGQSMDFSGNSLEVK